MKTIQEAYIVAATRTPVAKAPRGAFKNAHPADLLAHVLKAVVAQAPGIDPTRIDDVIVGCAMPEGEQGMNVARIGALLAGLPQSVSAQTVNRFCSSGLQAVALAADRIRLGEADLMLAAGDRLRHGHHRRERGRAVERLARGPGRLRLGLASKGVGSHPVRPFRRRDLAV